MADDKRENKKFKSEDESAKAESQKAKPALETDESEERDFTRREKIIIATATRLPDINIPEDYRSPSDNEELTPEPVPLEGCEMPKRNKKKKKNMNNEASS